AGCFTLPDFSEAAAAQGLNQAIAWNGFGVRLPQTHGYTPKVGRDDAQFPRGEVSPCETSSHSWARRGRDLRPLHSDLRTCLSPCVTTFNFIALSEGHASVGLGKSTDCEQFMKLSK